MSEHDGVQDSLSDSALDDLLTREHGDLMPRLTGDGAAWRRSLPGTEGLARHVRTLGEPPRSGMAPAVSRREDRRMTTIDEPSEQPSGSPVRTEPTRPNHFHRARQMIAAVAALVVVALFASVFAAQSHRHGPGASPTSTTYSQTVGVTPTALPPAGFMPAGKLASVSGLPVVSPADTRTSYVVNGAHVTRSDDKGATWTTLPTPRNFPSGVTVSWIDLFVSPLSAKTVYATADLSNPDNSQVNNCPAPLPLGHIGAKISLSGVVPCEVTEISVDGGATWSVLRMPGDFELGNASPSSTQLNMYNGYSANPIAQGNRLYSLAGHGPMASVGPDRLVSSNDGGATWQYADDGLVAQGQSPCQFAATPTGHTLFALTVPSSVSCDPNYNQPPQLWRSDDGGASWRQETTPSGRLVIGAALSTGAQPILYLLMPGPSQPHVGVSGAAVTDIFASADGGATWSQAPATGIPGTSPINGNAMTTLSDASLAVAYNDAPVITVYMWRPGQSSWTKLASMDNGAAIANFVNIPVNGRDALWLTIGAGNPQTGSYSVYIYTP